MAALPPSGERLRELLGNSILELIAAGVAREIASGLEWGEGPVWLAANRKWIFSDIPRNRVLAYSEQAGLSVFEQPSNFANGHTPTDDGGFLTCEHLSRSVTKTSWDGARTTICNRFDGHRLNSPNDVVVGIDGSIWFTDPTYGILTDVEGKRAPPEQSANRVYRYDVASGVLTGEIDSLKMPNGLCFSPDGRTLYVADSGAEMGPDVGFDPEGPRDVLTFAIDDCGRVMGRGRVFHRVAEGVPDGMRCDSEGHVWIATGRGIECLTPDGSWQGQIATPEVASNLAFGGEHGCDLVITTASRAYLLSL